MKILFILDSLRENYFTKDNELAFTGSKTGRDLVQRIVSAQGLNIKMEDVGITWAYNKIPPKNGDGSFKPVTKTLGKEEFQNLRNRIVEHKPDVIVPMGGTALMGIIGKKTITSLRGIPAEQIVVDSQDNSHECWMLPMVSLDSVWRNPSNKTLIDSDFNLLNNYLIEGSDAFQGDVGHYDWIENYDKAISILQSLVWHGKGKKIADIVAVDYETNTTKYWYKGAKTILFSASWKEGQGIAIPLDHVLFKQKDNGGNYLDHGWTPEQLKNIYALLVELFSCEMPKVLANGKFDIAFMKYNMGLPKATNCVDIQDMHYVAVAEESGAKFNRGLKTLAHQYTSMGGYEKSLNDWKEQYLIDRKENWLQSEKDKGNKPLKKDYQPRVNEIDGTSFSYEWIPLDILKPYASGDTDATLRVYHALDKLVRKQKSWIDLVYDFYPKLEDALTDLEVNGAHVDNNKAKVLKTKYVDELNRIKQTMIDTIPEVRELLNKKQTYLQEYLKMRAIKASDRYPNGEEDKERYKLYSKYYSPQPEVQAELLDFKPTTDGKEVLYGMRGVELPIESEYFTDAFLKKFKKNAFYGGNTSAIEDELDWKYYKFDTKVALPWVVEHYDDPFAKLMIEYSGINKVVTTYIDQIPNLSSQDGYVHTSFNSRGTVTSRLSSKDLNMQNIPRRTSDVTEFAYDAPLKQMFISRFKNGIIINCDFTSLEVYISALLSNDKGLIQALLDGKDIHKDTASKAWGVPYEDVDPEMRKSAKAVKG